MIDANLPTILSSSGKGGVGKSIVSCALAGELSKRMRVGLLDVDVRSPNAPYILGLTNQVDMDSEGHPIPKWARFDGARFPVFSSAFMYGDGTAITMPGSQMRRTIRDMLLDAAWPPDLEALVVDVDPGPGDSLAAVSSTMRHVYAVIVSTSDVSSLQDCAREIDAMENAGVHTLGVVANMVGAVSSCCAADLVCAHCGRDGKYGTNARCASSPSHVACRCSPRSHGIRRSYMTHCERW